LLQVSLQEPVLRAVTVSVEWPLPPRLPDVRGSLTDVLREALGVDEDWYWDSDSDGLTVVVWHEEERLHTIISGKGIIVVSERPDAERALKAATSIVAPCMELLALGKASACAAGATWTLAAQDAVEAEAALEGWLASPMLRERLNPLGGRPDDLIISVRYVGDGDVSTFFRVEPVTDSQAVGGGFFLSSDVEESEFAPSSLLAATDRREGREATPDEALNRLSRHLDHVVNNTTKALASVGGADESN
jgi:hypothetical protein